MNENALFSLQMMVGAPPKLSIVGAIGPGGVTAKEFLAALAAIPDDAGRIDLEIHSPGGQIFDGLAIYNAIKAHPARVYVRILGLAASMATVIAMAGDEISIPKNARIMIHDPSGQAFGGSSDMRQMADTLDAMKKSVVDVYTGRTGLSVQRIEELMAATTWMSADEAKKDGFVDVVTEDVKITNFFEDTIPMPVEKSEQMAVAAPLPAAAPQKPVTLEDLRQQYPDLAFMLAEEGKVSERERIKGVEDMALPGHDALIAQMRYDGKSTGADAAQAIIAAERAMRANMQVEMRADSTPPVALTMPEDVTKAVGVPDFMTLVQERRKSESCSMEAAMSWVVETNPRSHEQYISQVV